MPKRVESKAAKMTKIKTLNDFLLSENNIELKVVRRVTIPRRISMIPMPSKTLNVFKCELSLEKT